MLTINFLRKRVIFTFRLKDNRVLLGVLFTEAYNNVAVSTPSQWILRTQTNIVLRLN
jgi:hypothetical protein